MSQSYGKKMNDVLSQFIESMENAGLAPAHQSDIKPDNKRRDYQLSKDSKGKKKGYYVLCIEGDFGYGYFGDWRDNEAISWHSKTTRSYTDEEREAINAKLKKEREEQLKEIERRQNNAAIEAQDTALFLEDCPADHPYLVKKGVKPYGIFIREKCAFIPIHDDEQIWSYQTISPDGQKYIFEDGRKRGNWFKIDGDDTIIICEGYATGASLHEATGHTVYVAFDAGNLLPVASRVRQKYPQSDIIIAADNDHETISKRTGKPYNTGIEKGTIAAESIKARMIYPDFTKDDKGLSDFNDLHVTKGLLSVKEAIQGVVKLKPPEKAAGDVSLPAKDNSQIPGGDSLPFWQDGLQYNSKGGIIQRSTVNLLLIAANDPNLEGVFAYDSFAKRIIVKRNPPWEKEKDFRVRQLQDFDYVRMEAWLEREWDLKTGKARIADTIESTATLPLNTINPASEYFSSLEWDGVPRLEGWLDKYVSDRKQPKDYLSLVGKKFLCGLAARAMNPGIKFDTMIILEGRQYAGKSFLSKVMATVNGEEYFLDDFKDIENKDALMKMQGKLVIEFPEISTMRKTEVNDLKAFLSRTHDVFRPPYGRNTIESGRQCVFVGTVNPEGPYLRDVTGNRRYWPVSCRDKLDIPNLKEVMPHLHAEAAHLIKNGEQLWLKDDEYDLCVIEQDKRVMTDIWIDKIEEIVRGRDEITTDDLLVELNIPVEKRNQIVYTRLMQSMISLGYISDRVGRGQTRKRGYRKLGAQGNMIEEIIPWSN